MKYKLVVLDMDGTLLNSYRKISEENKKAISRLQSSGIKVAIATGRIFTSAIFYARLLGIEAPIIACNGAIIKDGHNNKTLDIKPINKDSISKIIEVFQKHKVYFHMYDEENIYVEKSKFNSNIYKNWNEDQSKKHKVHVEKMEDALDYFKTNNLNVLKMMAVDDDNNKMNSIREELKRIKNITIDKSWYNNLEVMNKAVSKGNGIKMLSEIYNINSEDIIAFGDNYNDLSMKDSVGIFVAMGNGEKYVKEQADYVTTSNDEHGVARGIENLIYNN